MTVMDWQLFVLLAPTMALVVYAVVSGSFWGVANTGSHEPSLSRAQKHSETG